jgi:hypothetical protein
VPCPTPVTAAASSYTPVTAAASSYTPVTAAASSYTPVTAAASSSRTSHRDRDVHETHRDRHGDNSTVTVTVASTRSLARGASAIKFAGGAAVARRGDREARERKSGAEPSRFWSRT